MWKCANLRMCGFANAKFIKIELWVSLKISRRERGERREYSLTIRLCDLCVMQKLFKLRHYLKSS
jgi:hypothetical protein